MSSRQKSKPGSAQERSGNPKAESASRLEKTKKAPKLGEKAKRGEKADKREAEKEVQLPTRPAKQLTSSNRVQDRERTRPDKQPGALDDESGRSSAQPSAQASETSSSRS